VFLELFLEPSNFEHRAMLAKRTIAVDRVRIAVGSCGGQTRHGTIATSQPRPIPQERYQ
jgi:hypothetical protein